MSGARRSGPVAGGRRPVRADVPDVVGLPDADGRALPLVLRPTGPDVDLRSWALMHTETVRRSLDTHGAVRFRGFNVQLSELAPLVGALGGELQVYTERSSPRSEVAPGIYTSTDHPPDQVIPLHCESSYQLRFPTLLFFHCVTAAAGGGQTPLADTRRVLERIPDGVRDEFSNRGLRYIRNYHAGLGVSWQEAFGTADTEVVGQRCTAAGISHEWRSRGGLRTTTIRPAIARHPRTAENVWFNHAAFFHISGRAPALRAALQSQFSDEDLPQHVTYGDGAPIADSTMAPIHAAYAQEHVAERWEAGDVLLVDNLLVAHGRAAFTGARRIVVGMAAPLSWDDVADVARPAPTTSSRGDAHP